jgi:hypothetical protein
MLLCADLYILQEHGRTFANYRSTCAFISSVRMQEEMLSYRLLIFVNDQIYFQCPCAIYNEELNWSRKPLTDSSKDGQNNASLFSTLLSEGNTNFGDFSIMIMYFSLRNLTFPTDTSEQHKKYYESIPSIQVCIVPRVCLLHLNSR